jgi:hypothetical protein
MPENKDVKALLADAIRKRDELNTFIKVLQEMAGGPVIPEGTNDSLLPATAQDITDPLTAVFPGMFFGKTQTQAVKLLLERVDKRPVKTKVIIECLKKGGLAIGGKKPDVNLWGVLNRSSDFILVPKAGWGLVDWYEPSVIAKYRKEGPKENGEEDKPKE